MKVEVKCQNCGKIRTYYPSRLKNGRGKHCSRKCSLITSGQIISKKQKGRRLSEETKKKLSKATIKYQKENGHPNLGKHWKMNPEKRKNMARVDQWKGKDNPAFIDGRSRERGYTGEWTKKLRDSIKERDKLTCKICGKKNITIDLAVHHIDYKKENCNQENLVSLCRSCHTMTNFNRKRWIKFFETI